MATIRAFKQRLVALKMPEVAAEAIKGSGENLLTLNREQMLEGKRRDGNDISPSYFEDPWFKSIESATAYSEWKDRITPHPKRKKGVPNLFIVGTFHKSITLNLTGESLKFHSTFAAAADIERKFTGMIYSLNVEKRTVYVREFLRPEFMVKVRFRLML